MPKVSLTPALADAICKLVEAGNRPHHAAKKMGVTESTWSRWVRQGSGAENPPVPECIELVQRIEKITIQQIEQRLEAALERGD